MGGGTDRAARLSAAHPAVLAAIDCGTNSTRLLVTGADGVTLDRRMRITRLGEGVDANRTLSPGAIGRTLEVLAGYRSTIDSFGAARLRAVATSAVRDAGNGGEFLERAAAVLGVEPEVLAGDAEGELSYRGATGGLPPGGGPYMVVDVGGGSTEIVTSAPAGSEGLATASLDVGCVRITERFLRHDPPLPVEMSGAGGAVRDLVLGACRAEPRFESPAALIGLAGTVSTLAMIDLGLVSYDRRQVHHHRLTLETIERLLSLLASVPAPERAGVPGLEPGRVDVIAGGAIVLSVLMATLGHESLLVSESDILDGIVASLR